MNLTTKNILLNILYYGIFYILFPRALLTLEKHFFGIHPPQLAFRITAILIGLPGIYIELWAIILFQKIGKGTPIVSLSPKYLVTKGPYKWVRNPLNIGELMILFSISLWFQSIGLFLYTILAAAAFHIFIIKYEEPKHLYRRQRGPLSRYEHFHMLPHNSPRFSLSVRFVECELAYSNI